MIQKRSIQPILNALMVFEEAARLSSFTLAAQSLGMAQPSVSRFIANLEQQIGVRLFARRHNRVTLTEPGARLYEATTLGLGHIRSVLDELSAVADDRTITISCTHGFAHMWILPRLDALKARLPGWEIRLVTTDGMTDYAPGGQQPIVCFGDGGWPGGEALLLFEEEVFPVCSPEFAARHGLRDRAPTPEDLATLPLLIQDSGEPGWLSWPEWFRHFGAGDHTPTTMQTVNNYAFILQAAMEGKGIALAWDNLIEPYLSNTWLIALSNHRVRTGKGYYLVLPPDHPALDAVHTWVREVA